MLRFVQRQSSLVPHICMLNLACRLTVLSDHQRIANHVKESQSLAYPDLKVLLGVDGSPVGGILLTAMHSGKIKEGNFAGRIMSSDKVQEMLFVKPVGITSTSMKRTKCLDLLIF